jgi:GNAT superfamily N-acetyltransferase
MRILEIFLEGQGMATDDPVKVGKWDTFSPEVFKRAVALVDAGGAIKHDADWIAGRMREAETLILYEIDGIPVGVAVLKKPLETYRQNVGKKSGFPIPENVYPLEVGYIAVDQRHQGTGIASKVFTKAVEQAGAQGLFSTSREESIWRLLKRFKFRHVGKQYDDGLKLFIQER